MTRTRSRLTSLSSLVLAVACSAGAAVAEEPKTDLSAIKAPQPTVPEVFTLMGQYVRVAYNNEGYVVLGYRLANASVGEDWMYLQAGVTLREGVKNQKLKPAAFSVKTPDGKTIPMATQKEYAEAGYLPALNQRGKITKDPLNYFPVGTSHACALQFFADLGSGPGRLAYDEVELSDNRACVGRLFFKIPGKITTGQHWLIVKFESTEVQVPFRILTKEEDKMLRKSWEDLKKALDEDMLK